MTKVTQTTWLVLGEAYRCVEGIAYPECPHAEHIDVTKIVGDVQCQHPAMANENRVGRWCALANKEGRCPFNCGGI